MSEPKLISPMLDNFVMGDPFSDRSGVRSCPAMKEDTGDKYIVKIISSPASPAQLDALLLTGAYDSKEAVLSYFEELANGIVSEAEVLQKLSELEGFMAFDQYQTVPMEDGNGYDVYFLSPYRVSLERTFRKESITHLSALNLGLDLCSALSVCRRCGYLYVDLKPENIYLTVDNGYRIGDLGFLKLDSLKYASLPDRYHSAYTAPEITDAFSSVDTTIDVYAVGLILYQAFNGGVLPTADPGMPLAPPDYADYEMAEIILKACHPEPSERWQDPVEMGQALVGYMQRNGAHDTPITPPSLEIPAEDEVIPEEVTEAPAAADEGSEEKPLYADFLTDYESDETLPGVDADDLDLDQVSEEVNDMLSQADELIAHPTPDPVVAPEAIDVPVPPPLPAEISEEAVAEEGESSDENNEAEDPEEAADTEAEIANAPVENSEEALPEGDEDAEPVAKPKRHWLRNSLIVVFILALLGAGIFYYQNFYLQLVDSIVLEGSQTELTVLVNSKIDEKLLTVICTDTYGNPTSLPVVDGKAVFKNLAPGSAYTVKLAIKGFHRLKGDTSSAYTTPVQTNILDFTAKTGQEDGSAVLHFSVEGPDASQWKIKYYAEDEEEKEVSFAGHVLTVTGLTIGKEYSFDLTPAEKLYFIGTNTVTHVASKLVLAEDFYVNSCADGKMTVSWSAPKGAQVTSWTVHCYNESGYNETVLTEQTTATFDGITETDGYKLEVTAAGMSKAQTTEVKENSISVTDFKISNATPAGTTLTWSTDQPVPQGGWKLTYTIDNSPVQEVEIGEGNTVSIVPLVPGATHRITLSAADGQGVVGGHLVYTAPAAADFSGYRVTRSAIEAKMCKTPSAANWNRYHLKSSDYTTTFAAGQKASYLMRIRTSYDTARDTVVTMYVIRDASGSIVSTATQSATWRSMWSNGYGEFNIPALPGTAGTYTISVYFNSALVQQNTFTVTA